MLASGAIGDGASGAASAGAQAVPIRRVAIASLLTNVIGSLLGAVAGDCGVVGGGLFSSAWIGHFAGGVLLALVGEGWKFALVQQGFDRLWRIVCYGFLHLGFCILKRDRHTRELPMRFGFALWPALVEPHTMSSFAYSLLEIVDHVLALR